MLERYLKTALSEALADTPVVFLQGARQTGKSTLSQTLASGNRPMRYLSLDDTGVLAAAVRDPAGFLDGLEGPVILDEIQRAPGLSLPLKAAVDRDRKPGRFLLTGSANALVLPRLSDELVGRMEILTLWPFSQGELEGKKETFLDSLFSGKVAHPASLRTNRAGLWTRILRGGYPEAVAKADEGRRTAWFSSYLTTLLHRDIRGLAQVEGWTAIPDLLSLVAARVGSTLNVSDISKGLSMPFSTLKRYLALLEACFVTYPLPAWGKNPSQRLTKAPKLHLVDTGLAAYLLGATRDTPEKQHRTAGALVENFTVMELVKQGSWSRIRPRFFHFRTAVGREVDLVLEDRTRLVGVETKSSATVKSGDFRGLEELKKEAGDAFIQGVVLYTGREFIPFGKNLFAVPMEALWA